MYNIAVALRRFQRLIRWTSKRYSVPGSVNLSQKDLEAEGYVVLVKCCRSFPEGEVRFARFFKRAFHNRLKDMLKNERRKKRLGQLVDLEEAFGIPTPAFDSMGERLESLRPILSENAYVFLSQMADPDLQVVEYAWREFCRRNKLHSQGISISGFRRFRIRPRHIKGALGISPVAYSQALTELKKNQEKISLTLKGRK